MDRAHHYIVIDQGTSSTKAFLFDSNGKVLYSKKIKHDLSRPKQFHVECDANVILNACSELFQDMVHASGDVAIHNVGLAVQRSTFLFWEKEIEDMFVEIDQAEEESWSPDFEEKTSLLMRKMDTLLKRMCTEERIVEKLDTKIQKVHRRIFIPNFENE